MGIPTASELGNLLTPEFELRKGEMPKSFVYNKVAEAWSGKPLITTGSWNTEQGEILEGEARPWFELEYEKRVRQVGFITTDDGRFGCSPDGLIEESEECYHVDSLGFCPFSEGCGLEIKSPAAHTHVKYLVNGALPKEYACQVMGSMFATGFKKWIFVSYRRGFPALVLEIYRDEKAMSMIRAAINQFHGDFDRAMTRITNISDPRNFLKMGEIQAA